MFVDHVHRRRRHRPRPHRPRPTGYEDFVVGAQYGFEAVHARRLPAASSRARRRANGPARMSSRPTIRSSKKLRELGALLHAQESFSHSYPHCWRCKNPLIFLAADQWFMSIDRDDLRTRIVAEIDAVQWIPAWVAAGPHPQHDRGTRPRTGASRASGAWGRADSPPFDVMPVATSGLYDQVIARGLSASSPVEGPPMAWFIRPARRFHEVTI